MAETKDRITITRTKHISLCELQTQVARTLDEAFPMPVWITAEIAELKTNRTGHCYLELVEKDEKENEHEKANLPNNPLSTPKNNSHNDPSNGSPSTPTNNPVPKASARAVVWRSVWTSLSAYFRGVAGAELAAGMKILVKVIVSYHELYGFSLQITDIDPSYTLGEAQRSRQQTIARLQSDGVFDMNRQAELPTVVQNIAVISSPGAAGLRDFMQELARYPFRADVTLFDATMQGHATEDSVISALEQIAARADEFDIVVIIRGGGSQSDLSAFDSYRLASHVAQFPLAVATGIGHDKDRSITDMVAALEFKTPTAVAVWIGEGLTGLARRLDELHSHIVDAAAAILERERLKIERAGRVVSIGAAEMTRRLEVRLERLRAEITRQSGELFLCEKHRLAGFSTIATERPTLLLLREQERLAAADRIVALRRPENILALGFAIVRTINPDGGTGQAILDPATIAPDQTLDITLAKGKTKAKTLK